MPELIEFDLDTLTLGELAAAEIASGMDSRVLLNSRAHQLLLSVFVQRWRSSGQLPNWNELRNLRVLDVRYSPSALSPDNPGPTSSD